MSQLWEVVHSIKLIRDAPGEFDARLARRGLGGCSSSILAVDTEVRKRKTELQKLQEDKHQHCGGDVKKPRKW